MCVRIVTRRATAQQGLSWQMHPHKCRWQSFCYEHGQSVTSKHAETYLTIYNMEVQDWFQTLSDTCRHTSISWQAAAQGPVLSLPALLSFAAK